MAKEKFEQLEKEEEKKDKLIEVDLIGEEQEKINKEAVEIKTDIEKMPEEERVKIGIGFKNFGFFAQEQKSKAMAWICEKAISGDEKIQEQGTTKRWLAGWAKSYRKDEELARKKIEEREESGDILKRAQNTGYLMGNIMKYGRTVADVVGWTASSPLRYVMMGAQFFARGAEAAKEARLMNQEVIEKTRVKDIDEAADEAWKIYEMALAKAEEKGGKVSKENLEKSYVENLPQDLLERLKKSEPGTATGILQRVLKKDLELAIKYGKVNETRLREYDRLISQYGTVDALAIGAKYAETASKAVIAGVSVETAYLGAQALWNNLPKIIAYYSWLPKAEVSQALKDAGQPVVETAPTEPEAVPPEALITEVAPESPTAPEPPVEKIIEYEYQGGKSIWQEAGKQWETRFKEFADLSGGDSKAVEALKTYNIDRIKDTVVDAIKSGDKDLIEKYGLTGISDPDTLTVDQLKGIKWSNVFEDTLKEKGLVENLRPEQVENIVKNNAAFREFFKEYPNAPRTSENYENILRGKGNTGIVSEAEIKPEPEPKIEPEAEPAPVKTPTETSEATEATPIETLKVIPGDLKASYVVGFDQVFNKGKVAEGLKNMFGSDIFGEAGIEGVLINRGDGVMIIKNAFGQKNFDLLLTDKTIAVDGPSGWNWGSKGAFLGFGDRIPTEKLSPETTKTAKNYILESVKKLSERETLGH